MVNTIREEKINPIGDVTRAIEKKVGTLSELNPKDFAVENGWAHTVAKNLGKMKITQLRKFFTEIKRIQKKQKDKTETESIDTTEIYLLHTELAYALGRDLITRDFYNLLKLCLSDKKLQNVSDYNRLVDFLEAILAYHKMEEAQKRKGG